MRGITILLLGLLSACSSSPTPSADAFQERLLATIPSGVNVNVPVAFSADGRIAAYVDETPDGECVVKGDWKSRRLDAI